MRVLNEKTTKELVESYIFADGLVRRAGINYGRGIEKSTAVIDISVRTEDTQKWVNLHFRVEGLEGYQLKQALNTTCEVLFDGVSVRFHKGLCYLDFSRDCHARKSVDDYKNAEFYFIGRRCLWDQLPYSEK